MAEKIPTLGDMIVAQQVLTFAAVHENYTNGYDVLVEAWEFDEILDFIVEHDAIGLDGFIKAFEPIREYRIDMMNTEY